MTERVREDVARYLAGDIDDAALTKRLPDAWEMQEAGDPALTDTVLRIMAYLAEFHNGDLPESELKDRLRLLFPSPRTQWIEQARRAVKSGTTSVSREASADTSP